MAEAMFVAQMWEEERKKQQAALTEAAIVKDNEQPNEYLAALESKTMVREAAAQKAQRFTNYKKAVKTKLVTEALKRIYVGSIKNPTPSENSLCEALLGNFIEERGIDNLLEGFKQSNTRFLYMLESAVDKHYNAILEEVDEENPDTMVIDRDNIREFMDEIEDTEDIDDVTNTIRIRIANAEEDFVNRNEQDKNNINDLLKDTAQRVADARPSNDNDYDEAIEGEGGEENPDDPMSGETNGEEINVGEMYDMMHVRRKINSITDRPRSIFDRMVRSVSEAAIKNPELRNQYGDGKGRLDMTKIVESVRCMYGLLEMVNTLKLEKVDAKYIEDTIKSI